MITFKPQIEHPRQHGDTEVGEQVESRIQALCKGRDEINAQLDTLPEGTAEVKDIAKEILKGLHKRILQFQTNKFFVWLIKVFGAFPVSRGKGDMGAINMSFEKLNSGRNLVIFPEGTRSLDGKVGRGKTGVALIAAVAQCPVIPVGINFEGKLKFRRKIVVRFGKPIDPEQLKVTTPGPKELKLLRTTIMDSITELVH